MNVPRRFVLLLLFLSSLLAACAKEPSPARQRPAEATAEPAHEETVAGEAAGREGEPIYLAIIWHQHQPVYFKDPETGIYAKPWVRLHAAKDYVDMAAMLEQYPSVHVTFNLTPSLIRQLDDLEAGATDMVWVMTQVPAAELSETQKAYVMQRFWDINPRIIDRFPRYAELRELRDGAASLEEAVAAFSTQDFLDLQVLFNLGWTDPDWLAEEPLSALVEMGRHFSESEKQVVLDVHAALIGRVIPIHDELQQAGQIEVTMTPYAHPILPLLVDTTLAKQAMPDAAMLRNAFQQIKDAQEQVRLGVAFYQQHFGVPPRGMWPAEGSVAQHIVGMVANNGIQWMASDEGVLAASLGMTGFGRDLKETVNEPDVLYRPYAVQSRSGPPVAMVFRDVVISDKVGFAYSGISGEAASTDLMNRVLAIRERLMEEEAGGPHLVTVILDGENAWEHYDNDGKAFLHGLYQKLSEEPRIRTVTPSEYLALGTELPVIEDLWAGSWISHDFSTWIGEEEENLAWDYLYRVREILASYERREEVSDEKLAAAKDLMYIAEGSDWFWWYGADQNSGVDEDFDAQFRATLRQVLLTLGEDSPDFLEVPIIPQRAECPEAGQLAVVAPSIDGLIETGEWDEAGRFSAVGGVMTSGQYVLERLVYGFGREALYLRLDTGEEWGALTEISGNRTRSYVGVYLSGGESGTPFSHFGRPETLLGFAASGLVEVILSDGELLEASYWEVSAEGEWGTPAALEAAISGPRGRVLEIALPYELWGIEPSAGDSFKLRAVWSQGTAEPIAANDTQLMPAGGPGKVNVPDLGLVTNFLVVADPAGDDHGPGSYTYPTDGVFAAGAYDLLEFTAGWDKNSNLVFSARLAGPVDNPWGAPTGLSIQTLDIYIDVDGPEKGSGLMLPGRNAAFADEYAWDYVLWVEGWNYGAYQPTADGGFEKTVVDMTITPDPGQRKIMIRIPANSLGEGAENWAYGVALLSQDGYPSPGVWRVRDVLPAAQQWRLGGAPSEDNTSHTRIMDYLLPPDSVPSQEELLGAFTPSASPLAELTLEDLAQVPMLRP